MGFRYFAEKLWYKLLYLFVVIDFLVDLNKLNKELLEQTFEPSFLLLIYDDYIALKFFVHAVLLFSVGCLLIYLEMKKVREGVDSFEEAIIACITIVVGFILLALIFVFIDNPILRAVLALILSVLGFVYVSAN